MWCELERGLGSQAVFCFEGLNNAARHVPCFKHWPAPNGEMITWDATPKGGVAVTAALGKAAYKTAGD